MNKERIRNHRIVKIEKKLDEVVAEYCDCHQDELVRRVNETIIKLREKGWLNSQEVVEARRYMREIYLIDC